MITQINFISKATNLTEIEIIPVIELLNEGATIPFIIRYRRDLIGAKLTEKDIIAVRDNLNNYSKFSKRFGSILENLTKRKLLTEELKFQLNSTKNLTELEAIYYPFKESRQTRMAKAIAMGFEPIADEIMLQKTEFIDFFKILGNRKYSIDEINAGVTDIISAKLTLNGEMVDEVRNYYAKMAILICKIKKNCDEQKTHLYRNYFDFSKKLNHISSHQFLAISRGVNEKLLQMKISIDKERCIKIIRRFIITEHRAYYCKIILNAIDDCFKRYLKPMLERELLAQAKKNADLTAINVFTNNLQQLLLTTPLGEKIVLALDPGFTNGVKFAVMNEVGKLLDYGKIFPFKNKIKSEAIISNLIAKHNIEIIALGNGTASNESMQFLKTFCKLPTIIVDECGASIYSVTDCAITEFPNLDSTIRSAVSIGRRLQNPLAELVKIPVESLGIGQYQHDVDGKLLKKSLDDEVIHCVNKYGVNLNLASRELLQYISGLNVTKAKNIVAYREKYGNFTSREQLKNVAQFGVKAFEQSCGFLKIYNADNILDSSSIHPESYEIANKILKLIQNDQLNTDLINDFKKEYGTITVDNIISEVKMLLNDETEKFDYSTVIFNNQINSFEELNVGSCISGKIVNITNFGAFLDVGIHENGFIHISEIANEFVSDINDFLKLNQIIEGKIISIDNERKKFALSLK